MPALVRIVGILRDFDIVTHFLSHEVVLALQTEALGQNMVVLKSERLAAVLGLVVLVEARFALHLPLPCGRFRATIRWLLLGARSLHRKDLRSGLRMIKDVGGAVDKSSLVDQRTRNIGVFGIPVISMSA